MEHVLRTIDVHLPLKVFLVVILANKIILKAHFYYICLIVREIDVVAHGFLLILLFFQLHINLEIDCIDLNMVLNLDLLGFAPFNHLAHLFKELVTLKRRPLVLLNLLLKVIMVSK